MIDVKGTDGAELTNPKHRAALINWWGASAAMQNARREMAVYESQKPFLNFIAWQEALNECEKWRIREYEARLRLLNTLREMMARWQASNGNSN